MKPEEAARQKIDRQLEAAGWTVQDFAKLNLGAARGVAIREFMVPGGFADYMLFVDRKALGAVEAKPEGVTLGSVSEQTEKYLASLPPEVPNYAIPLPFSFESTGVETWFRDLRDPDSRSRRVFGFHRPETLLELVQPPDTLRDRLRQMPPLEPTGLRSCQFSAIRNLEASLADNRPRALIQMATGSGKTYTAVSACYRLIKHAGARRILFLVDRSNLGKQTKKEFQQFITPDDGRKFTELYNVQRLTSRHIDTASRVCISTIQRVYSMLAGQEIAEDNELESLYETSPSGKDPLEVSYNPEVPIETFDFVIIDECHRSIYNLWRQVLEYFDAFLIGLTATPSKQTFGFFHQNLIMEYPHERAVADGVNVSFEVYRIKTRITEQGSRVEAGHAVIRRDKRTRRERIEQLDEELEYAPGQLDRSVVAPSQIRTVVRTLKQKLPELFPGRDTVPKTLIFAKDDNHAEEILHIVREEFGKGNDFCKKITYRSHEKPEDLIASFRNSYDPRMAVTVDMIATGTDIKPLECLVFMRDVKSSVYFDQMKGRGTRTIETTELQAVTPDAREKTHFVLVDAVGVTENDKTDTKPLERHPGVSFKKLMVNVSVGVRDEDTLSTLAGRLARLNQAIDEKDRHEIAEAAEGKTLPELINGLLDAVDPDKAVQTARELFDREVPTEEEVADAARRLVEAGCAPFDDPGVRDAILRIKERNEVTIDDISVDQVLYAGGVGEAAKRAEVTVESFRRFIEENKNEITALQIFYSQPYGRRHFTLQQIRELAEAIQRPPYSLSTDRLWEAYRQLEQDRVKGVGEQRLLTDIISLVRHAMGEAAELVPFREAVEQRFDVWMANQRSDGREFTAEQLEWLGLIREHVAASLSIEAEDLEFAPFHEKGGRFRAVRLFGAEDFGKLMAAINEVVAA